MIAVDWGTSSLRAYRLADDGSVRETRSAAVPLLECRGRFAETLAAQLDGWDDPQVLMAGMIGSRNGWHEVPYVACPAGLPEIAAGILEIRDGPRRIGIAPGLVQRRADAAPEVMRGEETQVLGLADRLDGPGPHTLCLPGTHSKWITLEAGRIIAFATAMTGELYALLRTHSLLGALMQPDAGDDTPAFVQGLAAAEAPGGLPHHLFGVRTRGLLDGLAPAAAPSYLSGLLIGHELRGLAPARGSVHLIGGAGLTLRYERALRARGLDAVVHGEALTARGLWRLAQARALPSLSSTA